MSSNSPFPPGAALVAYLRDSGGRLQDQSIAQQEAQLRAWAADHHHTLAHIFKDEAVSGASTVGRSAFDAMIHHFRNGAQEAGLLLWSYARFARDFDDAQFYKADLRRRGFTVHALIDHIPEGPIGRVLESMIDWKNQQYLEDLSREIRRGMAANITVHRCAPGTPPTGYLAVPHPIGSRRDGSPHVLHRWQPDPAVAPLVRLAFELRAARHTYKQIHARTRLHRYTGSYRTMFRNPIYHGELHYAGLVVPDFVEPIVEKCLWDAVQEVQHFHQQRQAPQFEDSLPGGRNPGGIAEHPRRINSPYILSGLAVCGHCGAPLSGRTIKKKDGRRWHYYRCPDLRRADRPCPGLSIPKQVLEDHVLAAVRETILQPHHLQDLRRALTQSAQHDAGALQAQLDRLTGERARTRAGIRNTTAAIRAAGHSPALLADLAQQETALAELDAGARTLEDRIAALHRQHPALTLDQLQALAAAALHNLDQGTPAQRRRLLRGLIHQVEVTKTKDGLRGTITYYPPAIAVDEDGAYTFTNPHSTEASHRHNIPLT